MGGAVDYDITPADVSLGASPWCEVCVILTMTLDDGVTGSWEFSDEYGVSEWAHTPYPDDYDGDNVRDAVDDCPHVYGFRDFFGCPEPLDGDGDGVPDYRDDCRHVPGPESNGGCPIPVNAAPQVKAGADRAVVGREAFALTGTAGDDGLPSDGRLETRWSVVSGPGAVSFVDASVPATKAKAAKPGRYVLRLTAADGQYTRTDDVAITVKPDTYVALGDSFSSGEGAGSYLDGTDKPSNRCYRSSRAYGPALAKGLKGKLPRFVFRACGGAELKQFREANKPDRGREPAQKTALDGWTGLTTLSFGGNDIGFDPLLRHCLSPLERPCDRNQESAFDAALGRLSTDLPKVFKDVRTPAPRAQESFHPTARGQAAFAVLVSRAYAALPKELRRVLPPPVPGRRQRSSVPGDQPHCT
ncbi:GDSL-type esterase/lipase family protein [Streptomyces bambusae]|uniref:PKD domain-containing protein n=1 Tax=Streptomyces bambusae TaxID=1550616 RepID=UPI001CFE123D|nr:GDSL-type esterase/lipase family protein [Streptomyces bambusae]MCB5168329.1 GDSL-type esterase/lipase family protein [Streptomyces bambusae]